MNLTVEKLGEFLHLAECATNARENINEIRRDDIFGEQVEKLTAAASQDRQDAVRKIERFLRTLPSAAFKDLAAIYGLGRYAGDHFYWMRGNLGHELGIYPWILSQRIDLTFSVARGLPRLGEPGALTAAVDGDAEIQSKTMS
jgi:hypothetical protein